VADAQRPEIHPYRQTAYASSRHPAAQTEWSRHHQDADFDDPQWVDPGFSFSHHRDLLRLTQAVRDELARTLAAVGRTLDMIDAHPRKR
jgi:hypothetical protein